MAVYTQATFILAKAKHNREVAAVTIDHLRRFWNCYSISGQALLSNKCNESGIT